MSPAKSGPEILAVIPARGGSKGIPRKNLARVLGKPLIAYSIEQALRSRHITRTIVSTDDKKIAEVAGRYGAETPFIRPARFAGDFSLDIEVFRHALEWLRRHEGYSCDLLVHLRPTTPARRVTDIDRAIEMMLADSEADSLRAVVPSFQSPYKMWTRNGKYMKSVVLYRGFKESHSIPRQLLPQTYWQNGCLDVIRPRTVLRMRSICGKKVIPFVMEGPTCDIDTREDLARVGSLLRAVENE